MHSFSRTMQTTVMNASFRPFPSASTWYVGAQINGSHEASGLGLGARHLPSHEAAIVHGFSAGRTPSP